MQAMRTCYVLLCYWRIIDVALASVARSSNEPARIGGELGHRIEMQYIDEGDVTICLTGRSSYR